MKNIFRFSLILVAMALIYSYGRGDSTSPQNGIIGVRLEKCGDYTRLAALIEGTPAEQNERIQPGAILLGFSEPGTNSVFVSVRNKSTREVSDLLKGPAGSHVVLELAMANDQGDPIVESVELVRMATGDRDWRTASSISRRKTTYVGGDKNLYEFLLKETATNSQP